MPHGPNKYERELPASIFRTPNYRNRNKIDSKQNKVRSPSPKSSTKKASVPSKNLIPRKPGVIGRAIRTVRSAVKKIRRRK